MKAYMIMSKYQYGEMTIKDIDTGKEYTLNNKKTIFNEDYYSVVRFAAVENVDADTVPDPIFYLYNVSYMQNGYCSVSFIIDEETIEKMVRENVLSFMHGNALELLKNVHAMKTLVCKAENVKRKLKE